MTDYSQLETLRVALLDQARSQARDVVEAANLQAASAVEQAREEVEAAVAKAQARGLALSRERAARQSAEVRQRSVRRLLRAQAEVQRDVFKAVDRSVKAMRDEASYPQLLDALESLATHQLGPGAVVVKDPPGVGGVVATIGARRVDLSLDALAPRIASLIADEVGELWS